MHSIKLLVLDVDGTLTDGKVIYGNGNAEFRAFSIKDGLIPKYLPLLGISVVFLTGYESEAITHRASDLGALAIQKVENKLYVLKKLLEERSITPEQCAFIGDDLNDYSAMMICGFKACPADAVAEIRDICDFISTCNGGQGAVRDICEELLKREGKQEKLMELLGII